MSCLSAHHFVPSAAAVISWTDVVVSAGRASCRYSLEGELDAMNGKLIGMLIGGREDRAILDSRLDRRDVVKADDEYLTRSSG